MFLKSHTLHFAGLTSPSRPSTFLPMTAHSPLPYRDTRPHGAADDYFVINATFRFILREFGWEELRRYWSRLGREYYAPVSQAWREGGLPAVASYWRAFFAAEPLSEVLVSCSHERVELEVKTCPAIGHLRAEQREIVPCYCQHCYFVGQSMAEAAGLAMRVEGGNGSCRQVFFAASAAQPSQELSRIEEVR